MMHSNRFSKFLNLTECFKPVLDTWNCGSRLAGSARQRSRTLQTWRKSARYAGVLLLVSSRDVVLPLLLVSWLDSRFKRRLKKRDMCVRCRLAEWVQRQIWSLKRQLWNQRDKFWFTIFSIRVSWLLDQPCCCRPKKQESSRAVKPTDILGKAPRVVSVRKTACTINSRTDWTWRKLKTFKNNFQSKMT